MKFAKYTTAFVISFALSSILFPLVLVRTVSAQTQDLHIALQRGYRTGYSDGYMAGYRDIIDGLDRSFARHEEYSRADRAFNKDYGAIEDYRDGYQQGFESGYSTGFEKRSFESTVPSNLSKRGIVIPTADQGSQIPPRNVADNNTTVQQNAADNGQIPVSVQDTNTGVRTDTNAIIIIPRDTELILELQDDLSTEKSVTGQKFTAKVVSPSEIAGAIIEGRIAKITAPGRIKRRSELSLSFDRIVLSDTRWSNFSAILTEVMPVKGDNIKMVDAEGTAVGQSSYKNDAIKVGAATGTGLVVGGLVGGPVGAGVGAGVGAAFGVGAVVIERGKHIRINRNQQLRIKTAYETQIR